MGQISLLKGLVETRSIRTPTRSLPTHPSFSIFLTQRVTDARFGYHYNPTLAMLGGVFRRVWLRSYDDSQLKQVGGFVLVYTSCGFLYCMSVNFE